MWDSLVIKLLLFITTCASNYSVVISVLATTPSFRTDTNTTAVGNNNCLLIHMLYVPQNYSPFGSLLTLLCLHKQTFIIDILSLYPFNYHNYVCGRYTDCKQLLLQDYFFHTKNRPLYM